MLRKMLPIAALALTAACAEPAQLITDVEEYGCSPAVAWSAMIAATRSPAAEPPGESGKIQGQFESGADYQVEMTTLGPSYVRISIQTAAEKAFEAHVMQRQIAAHIVRQAPQGASALGSRVHTTYAAALPMCLIVARKTFQALGIPQSAEEIRGDAAWISGKRSDGTQIWIQMFAEGSGRTHVNFVVGTENIAAHRRSVLQIKAMFDEILFRGSVEH